MLFPFRHSTIFRSRWIALLWAAGMCFTAVEIAGMASHEADDSSSVAETPPGTAGTEADAVAALLAEARRVEAAQHR